MQKTSLENNHIFVILGFARSGTSVITRGLKAIGVDLGEKIAPTVKHSQWNPTGFWEDEEIMFDIHSEVYALLNQKVRGIAIINKEEQTSEKLRAIRMTAATLIKQRFSTTTHWGFKDPNTAKIIPFWQSVFSKLGLNEHYIIALRNPLASARSFATLTKTDLETGLLLWLTHIIPAVDETIGKNRIVVSYENVLQKPAEELERMRNSLHINIPLQQEEVDSFCQTFLDRSLHHNHFDQHALYTHASVAVAPLCSDVYDLLFRVARDELTLNSEEFNVAWKTIKHKFDAIYPVYCYIDAILQKNQALRKKMRTMEKSIGWRLSKPARWVDERLRVSRHSKRKKKRLITAYE